MKVQDLKRHLMSLDDRAIFLEFDAMVVLILILAIVLLAPFAGVA